MRARGPSHPGRPCPFNFYTTDMTYTEHRPDDTRTHRRKPWRNWRPGTQYPPPPAWEGSQFRARISRCRANAFRTTSPSELISWRLGRTGANRTLTKTSRPTQIDSYARQQPDPAKAALLIMAGDVNMFPAAISPIIDRKRMSGAGIESIVPASAPVDCRGRDAA